MNLYEAIEQVDSTAEELINTMNRVSAERLGLDPRAGYTMYAVDEAVAVRTSNIGPLYYYGGFEYVNKENIKVIGEYTFFLRDEERIRSCLDYLEEHED